MSRQMDLVAGWKWVAAGLRLKLAALLVFLMVPVLALLPWLWGVPTAWPAASGLVAALALDCAGRGLCLAAPIRDRLAILASMICQLTGILAIIGFGVGAGGFGLAIGLTLAVFLQIAAAILFTQFLKVLAEQLGDLAMLDRVRSLRRGLFKSLVTSFGLQLAILIVAGILAIIAVFTAFLGLYFAVPLAALAMFPLGVLWLWVVAEMYWHYAAALSEIRRAALEVVQAEVVKPARAVNPNGMLRDTRACCRCTIRTSTRRAPAAAPISRAHAASGSTLTGL